MRAAVLLVVAELMGCGPSAAEVEAARTRAIALAEIAEGTALHEWQAALVSCEIIRMRALGGQEKFTDAERAPCLAREAKRENYIKACVAARADQTACELRAQRAEQQAH